MLLIFYVYSTVIELYYQLANITVHELQLSFKKLKIQTLKNTCNMN